mgnify:CR=1 FL=1
MEIRIREAKLEDKEKIIEFLREINPNDYIFNVLDFWLKDESGKVLVAEHEGKIVAMNHFYQQNKESGWLEGARVHKDYRGRGIATMLALRSLELLKERGVKKARLVTSATNIAAQRHLTRTPFKLHSKWLNINFQNTKFVNVEPYDNFSDVYDFLIKSKIFNELGRLCHDYFSWFDFNEEWLKNRIFKGEVYCDGENLVIITSSTRRGDKYSVSYLECNSNNLIQMLNIAYSLANLKNKASNILFVIPSLNEYKKILEKEKIEYYEQLVYEALIL